MRPVRPSLALVALVALVALAALAALVPPLVAQTAAPSSASSGPPPSAPPKCAGPEFRQLDFWVGDWDVSIQGKPVGVNRVTREEDGCLVHEHWASAQGETGQSLNFYDRNDGKWHQVWVSSRGGVLDLAGRREANALAFTGETRRSDGTRVLHRLTFFDNPDGTVRQLWDISTDGGTSWQTSWDAIYRRQAKPAKP